MTAIDGNGQQVIIQVFRKRGSTYLSFNGRKHLAHPSNLRRANGFAIEAMLVYHVTDAAYRPF